MNFALNLQVLLVEDDVVNRKIGQRLLQSLDCRVTVTCNGQEALDVLRAPSDSEQELDGKVLPPQFDLVLMDLQMPVMDGTHAVFLPPSSLILVDGVVTCGKTFCYRETDFGGPR